MATLNLIRPASASQAVLPITDQITEYTFDFDLFEAIIEKIDDNLVITFEADGSSIILEDFYAVYNSEFMPNFVLDGELVSGEDFFNAMDPTLMPAAGPENQLLQETNQQIAGGVDALAGGVNALGGTDGGSSYDVNPNLFDGGGSDGGNDGSGGSDDNTPPNVEPTLSFSDDLTKDVANAQLSTHDDADKGRTDTGSFTFTPGNGPTDVTINGTSIFDANGDIITTPFEGSEGSLTITSYDESTGEVTYSYTQKDAGTHPENDVLQDKFEIEVTDQDGDSITGSITVDIIDDVPVAKGDAHSVSEDASITDNVVTNDEASADGGDSAGKELVEVKLTQEMLDDGWTASGSLENNDLSFSHNDKGTIVFEKDGDYTFTPKDNVYKNEAEDLTFEYTIKDSDGDTSSSTLKVTLTDEASGSGDVTSSTVTIGAINEDSSSFTFDVELNNDAASYKEGTVQATITLPNGATDQVNVTINADGTGSYTYNFENDYSDVYNDNNGSIKVEITGVKNNDGSVYENFTGSNASETIAETIDETVITIKAPADTDENATSVTYTLEVNNAPQTNLTIKLSNGQEVTIKAGELSAEFTVNVREDDVYKDENDTISVEIVGHDGGNYEDVSYNNTDSTVIIQDDADITSLTLSAGEVTEGGTLSYTLNLNNPTESEMTVKVDVDGTIHTVTIPAGSKTANFDVKVDANTGGEEIKASITESTGGNFENLTTSGEVKVTIKDVEAPTLDSAKAEITLDEGSMASGTHAELTTETVTWTPPAGYTIHTASGSGYDITKEANGSLTITLDGNASHGESGTDDTIIDGNSITVTLKDAQGNFVEVEVDVNIIDDAPVQDVTSYDATTGTDGIAHAIVDINFGADDGEGKIIKLGEDEFEFKDGEWKAADGSVGSVIDNEDGSYTLKAQDGSTLTDFGNDSGKWLASVKENTTVEVTDSDGDSVEFEINPTTGNGDDTVLGLEGDASYIAPATDYNVSIILDTSASMWDGYHGGVIDAATGETRLDAACDAIIDLVQNTLVQHTQSEVGGEVNIQITDFYGKEGDSYTITLTEDNLDEVLAHIESIRNLKYDEIKLDDSYVAPEGQAFIVNNQGDTIYIDEDGTPLNAQMDANGIVYDRFSGGTDYHHGTAYELGFDNATEWFESLDNDGAANEVFFMTDGQPWPNNTTSANAREEAFKELSEAVAGGNIHAIGMGSKLEQYQEFLDQYDTTGGADLVTDANISNFFKPDQGGDTVGGEVSPIGITLSGDDVIVGGTTVADLKGILSKEFNNMEISDALLMDYLRNNPDWINSAEVLEAVGDDSRVEVALSGEGDDYLFGKGGNDLLIADGNADALSDLAQALNAEGANPVLDADNYTYDSILESGQNVNADPSHDDLSVGLVGEFTKAFADGEVSDTFIDAINNLESANDGNDIVFGGEGNDFILGLGGDDTLYGGEGNDVIFAGSGNDIIYAGEGDDIIYTGAGNDTVYLGEGNDTVIFDTSDILDNVDSNDTIHDFDTEHDLLDLTAFDLQASNVNIVQSENGEDAEISFDVDGSTQTITLVGAGSDVLDMQEDLGTDDSFIKI